MFVFADAAHEDSLHNQETVELTEPEVPEPETLTKTEPPEQEEDEGSLVLELTPEEQ